MVNSDEMVEVEIEIPDEMYEWILSEVGGVKNVQPFLQQAVKDFVLEQKDRDILKNATVHSLGC